MEMIGRSLVHHGKFNDRAYLMKLRRDDWDMIVPALDALARSRGYSKIFAKIPSWALDDFLSGGYRLEARIPGFYRGADDVCFMGRYFCGSRSQEQDESLVHKVLAAAHEKSTGSIFSLPPDGFKIGNASEENVEEMAEIYGGVFASYPFPIHDPGFLLAAMKDSTRFFAAWNGDRIAALSSAEMDFDSSSAEMTDFATLHDYRGKGLALHLLRHMEDAVRDHSIRSLFTIARAYSYSMNITFARNGYHFAGTLTNNTNIGGRLESMNVWYKILGDNSSD
jgi:putative beta-lysine N-acetyltransferase